MERFTPDPLFYSIDHKTDKIEATEEEIANIYDAAYRGLTGDALAIASGFLPVDFNRLCQFDPKAAEAVLYARAKNHAEVSGSLMRNALNGDTKAATTVLTHLHGWKPAKPENDNSNELRIVIENTLPDPIPEQKAIS
jgi:hypothetical protein